MQGNFKPRWLAAAAGRLTAIRSTGKEAVVYGIVQILAFALELAVFAIVLYFTETMIVTSNLLGKIAAGGFAFVAHRIFTFRGEKKWSVSAQAGLYALSLLANAGISSCALVALVFFGLGPFTAKIVADVGLIALTFTLTRQFIFSRKQSVGASRSRAGRP
jgi:putative flippase GtrA